MLRRYRSGPVDEAPSCSPITVAAKALGLTIPLSLQAQADEVVE